MITIEVNVLERCAVVTLVGEADHEAAPELERRLMAEIDAGRANLVINGGELAYISSAGLRALIAAQTRARHSQPQGKIVFAALSAPVHRTFKLVGFHELFEFYPDEAAATGSFA